MYIQLQTLNYINCIINCNIVPYSYFHYVLSLHILYIELQTLKCILCILLLLQSALQTLWDLACSTIVEYSQQEGFYRVPLPVARLTPNLEDQ